MQGLTDTVLMIRPKQFGPNEETLSDNAFQNRAEKGEMSTIAQSAIEEFDKMVIELERHDIRVMVIEDKEEPYTPDAIFPNNWFSTHGTSIATYPMMAESRRAERREDLITQLVKDRGYKKRYGFEYHEEQELYLEGTGSMVLDRDNKIAYACLSQRTSIKVLEKFSVLYGYHKVVFSAFDDQGGAVYHTNVLMTVGDAYVIICLDSIRSEEEKAEVVRTIQNSGKEIIEISHEQMNAFAGNMLQVKSKLGEKFLVLSKTAYDSLDTSQIDKLSSYNKLIKAAIPTIEKYGGGSVRCMIAEIF